MHSTRQFSICFRVFSLLLLLILISVTSQPIHAQDPVERNVPDTSLELAAIEPEPSPEQLAAAMDIPTDALVSASIGESDSRGTGVENPALGIFPQPAGGAFAILSTGLAESADNPNNGGYLSTPPGENGLDGLNNSKGHDLVQLTLVLTPPPGATGLNFDFAFYSEEFPEWVGSPYNDAFIVELGVGSFTSGIDIDADTYRIDSPYNFAHDPEGNVISVNTVFGHSLNTGTTYDGTTGLLTAIACLPKEVGNNNVVLILSITDLGDNLYDSAVFLDNFQWGNQPDCSSGVVDSEPYHISFQKEWLGLDQGQLPNGLPDDFQIVATSDVNQVTCYYDNSILVCDNNNELLVPPTKTYTVQEFNVPVPWEPEVGAGVDSAVEFNPAAYPECDDNKQCTHTVTNKQPSPTAISLLSFEVEANDGRAMIMWETGTEIDNAGFNLYRAISPDGPWSKLNSALIAAEGDPVSGASYTFVDTPGRGTFYYRLEDVDYFGVSTLHHPVIAELGAVVRVPWFRPSWPKF